MSRLRKRALRQTLLIVHEGYAEEYLLRHLKAIYNPNCSVHLVNARGGGAVNVVNVAEQRGGSYDRVAAMFDTDAGCDDLLLARTKERGIIVLPHDPCIEATLLKVGSIRPADGTRKIKNQFERRYGGPAHQDRLISSNFTRSMFDASRNRIVVLDLVIKLLSP